MTDNINVKRMKLNIMGFKQEIYSNKNKNVTYNVNIGAH